MTLYEYLEQKHCMHNRPIITICDYRYNDAVIKFEAPFCHSDLKHKVFLQIAKSVKIVNVLGEDHVVTDLSDVLERSINESAFKALHLPADINGLMSNINTIFSEKINDFWLVRFAALIK